MTETGLFSLETEQFSEENEPCGCNKRAGHTCKPPFIDEETDRNWPETEAT